jgi:predicted transposase YbfD/YdcC
MHCQTKIAEVIRAEGADYMLQVKDNQRHLHKEIAAFFTRHIGIVHSPLKMAIMKK